MACFLYNSIMSSKKEFRKFILLTVYLTHIQCLMIICQSKKQKDIYCAIVLREIKLNTYK